MRQQGQVLASRPAQVFKEHLSQQEAQWKTALTDQYKQLTDYIIKITQVHQPTQLDNPMKSEEGPQETKLETNKIRLEMKTEFKRWKVSVQEECITQFTSIRQLETKRTEMK